MSQTTKRAFETHVKEILLGQSGWNSGTNAERDKERALFPARVFAFLQDTQAELWQQMRDLHSAGLESMLIAALVKELDIKGALHVLRHGFKFYGKTFRLAYFKPAHGLNYEIIDLFNKNQLTIIGQTPCHPSDNSTVDMVFAVNGVPVATCELKNPGTGQSWRKAVNQYREYRDPERNPAAKNRVFGLFSVLVNALDALAIFHRLMRHPVRAGMPRSTKDAGLWDRRLDT